MDDQSSDRSLTSFALNERNTSGGNTARNTGLFGVLAHDSLWLSALGIALVAVHHAYKNGVISQLSVELAEYGILITLGLIVIRVAGRIVDSRLVRNVLTAAVLSLVVSAFVNITNNIPALDTWPILGIESRVNDTVKYTFQVLAIILTLISAALAIVSLRSALDELRLGRASLLSEITQRTKVEEILRRSEEKYRKLFENSAVGVVIFNAAGKILAVNSAMIVAAGSSREELARIPLWDIFANSCDRDVFLAAMERNGLVASLDVAIKHNEGSLCWIRLSSKAIPYEGEDAFLTTALDITEQKRAEAEQTRLESQIRQTQKMNAIGQLTGGIAHDFNNMLQVINCGTQIVLDKLEATDPVRDTLSDVANAGDRAARLVSQLLLFSRRQVIRPETLDLNVTVAGLLKLLSRVLGEHIQLQWHPGRQIGNVYADQGMIEQTLMNLCINARDAMPDGGILTIETKDTVVDDHFRARHSWAVPGRYVLLSVQDTGCGMGKDVQEHIFEPFFTTKEQGKGTGLGLATVYGIVKQHHGMLNFYSEPGKGSTFSLYWPVSESQSNAPAIQAEEEVPGGSETILLAEDDEMVMVLTRKLLEAAGYSVLTAKNGVEAVALFEECGDRVHLAILDVVMPTMGGRDAYNEMQKRSPGLKALFMSGYSESAIHTNFVLEKGLTLIQKPFSRATFLQAMRTMLDRPIS